jgi:hypothetical protein
MEWTKEVMEPKSEMSEVHESHRPLEAQRLIPRKGYEGKLTNRICLKWYGDKCEAESIKEYSLKDKSVRELLIKLQFACHIGGKRYRVCPDREGFCRREKKTVCKKWGKKVFSRKKVCRKWEDEKKESFIPVSNYNFLLDASTECKKGL